MKQYKPTLRMTHLAAASALLFAGVAAQAQDAAAAPPAEAASASTSEQLDKVVVTGIRASTQASLDAKRRADQIVDVVTATEAGKFPDANIADSLQRITGVAIDRNGGEGQYITVRGFGPQYNNVLVNGRTMATDGNGREFSFDTLSSGLISRAEVFKTYQPQLQEGGIGATVNIQTARPLDAATGFHIAANVGGTHDLLAKKTSPVLGALATYSNAERTFGVEFSLNYTDRKSLDDSTTIDGWLQVTPNSKSVAIINGSPASTGLKPSDISWLNDGGTQALYIPQNLNFRRSALAARRLTTNATVQFVPTDTVQITLDGLFSGYKVNNNTNYFAGYYTPPYFSDVSFDGNGTATHFTRPGTGFAAANPLLAADPRFSNQQNDNVVSDSLRDSKSNQLGANVQWEATDRLKFEADLSKSHASQDGSNQFVVVGSNPMNAPQFTLGPAGSIPAYVNTSSITDPTILRTHYTAVSASQYRDDITEMRVSGEWQAFAGALRSIQFGGFYSDRKKTDTEYYTPGANNCTYCGYVVPIDTSLVSPYSLSNYLTKTPGSGGIPTQFFQYDAASVIAFLSQPSTLAQRSAGQQGNVPTATFLATGGYTPALQPGSGFSVTEKVSAAYVNSNWKGTGWAANAGLRIADTKTTSVGFSQPLLKIRQNVGDSNLAFDYGAATAITETNHYRDYLPSANIKFDLSSTLLARLAVSKTLTRPTLSSLGTNNSYGGRVTQAQSSGGNPDLQPFKSWNYDASLEWYASRNVSLSIDGFYKKFSSFISNQTIVVPRNGFDQQGNAVVYNFYDTRPRNGNNGSVKGLEAAGQYAFESAGPLSGFGVGANYTYVTSDQKVLAPSDCAQIEGLSKNSYNLNGFYEKNGIQVRLAYNWRSQFLAQCRGPQGQPANTSAYGQLDFNASFDVTKTFQVYLEGANLTDKYVHQYSIYTNRFLKEESYGRRLSFGLRAKF